MITYQFIYISKRGVRPHFNKSQQVSHSPEITMVEDILNSQSHDDVIKWKHFPRY